MNRMNKLYQSIDYHFQKPSLLEKALTHPSCNNDRHCHENNERLEFLGDSVLSMIVAEHLYKTFPDRPEGELTKIRASLVCDQSLSEFARRIHLGEFLLMGKGEEASGGRDRKSNLENAFEALIAAIYLDGGLEAAKRFIMRFIPENIEPDSIRNIRDYKTTLQEIIQQNPEEKIHYCMVGESGPDHDKVFDVEVHLNSNVIGKGRGKSKKQAEQNAAKQALDLMGYNV